MPYHKPSLNARDTTTESACCTQKCDAAVQQNNPCGVGFNSGGSFTIFYNVGTDCSSYQVG